MNSQELNEIGQALAFGVRQYKGFKDASDFVEKTKGLVALHDELSAKIEEDRKAAEKAVGDRVQAEQELATARREAENAKQAASDYAANVKQVADNYSEETRKKADEYASSVKAGLEELEAESKNVAAQIATARSELDAAKKEHADFIKRVSKG